MAIATSGDTHTFHHAMADRFAEKDIQRKENDWSTSVHTLYGIKDEPGPQGGKTEVVGFEFVADEFSVSDARDWLEDQGHADASLVEEGMQRENPGAAGLSSATKLGAAGVVGFLLGMNVGN